ncbi:acyltransferase [Butyrivibrio sp. VCD2006]|uniref:acyltransferase n=1 Tax=Butyrivibrio sp. VCD2006 TaxID=1280664 RepID=UPI0018CA41A7|nr:acyltransferase family protein [Butyrivibrio sp. VCD2006]
MIEKERADKTVNIDVIRILAGYFIVAVHYFLVNGYYQQIFEGVDKSLFVMTYIRIFNTTCVPLFMMLSGYLLLKKTEFTRGYIPSRLKPFIIYVMFSILRGVVGVYRFQIFFTGKTFFDIVLDTLSFGHAWYIEFYFGFVLLVPFINKIWANCTLNEKRVLILSLAFISSLGPVLNVYNLKDLDWWSMPSKNAEYNKIITDYWTSLYPFLYYFLGAYLRERYLKINKMVHVLLILVMTFLICVYTYWRNLGTVFILENWCNYPSIFIVVLSVLVFSFVLNLDISFLGNHSRKIIRGISSLIWGGFLSNEFFQNMFYPIMQDYTLDFKSRLLTFFIFVPIVFVCSLILSYLMELLYSYYARLFISIKNLFKP